MKPPSKAPTDGACVALMKEMGSASGEFTPEPPVQWKWQIKNGDAEDRVLGLVRENSTGKFPPRAWTSGLSNKKMAHRLDCSEGHVANTLTELIAQGRLRRKAAGALGLCAAIKPAKPAKTRGRDHVGRAQDGDGGPPPPEGRTNGEAEVGRTNGENSSPVQVSTTVLGGKDILLQIQALKPYLQIEAWQWGERFDKWALNVFTAKAAEARKIIARLSITHCLAWVSRSTGNPRPARIR